MTDLTIDGLPLEVVKADTATSSNKTMLTARITVDPAKPEQMKQALLALRTGALKELVIKASVKMGLVNYGVSVSGGVRPWRDEKDGDKVKAYEQDFKFTAGI